MPGQPGRVVDDITSRFSSLAARRARPPAWISHWQPESSLAVFQHPAGPGGPMQAPEFPASGPRVDHRTCTYNRPLARPRTSTRMLLRSIERVFRRSSRPHSWGPKVRGVGFVLVPKPTEGPAGARGMSPTRFVLALGEARAFSVLALGPAHKRIFALFSLDPGAIC